MTNNNTVDMNRKNESPADVVLEKSSTGRWSVPGAPKRRLKPWQRLWLVTGIIYLLLLAGSCYLLMPTREGIERRMVFSVIEEVRRYDGMAFAGESPRKNFEIARSQGYAAWIKATRTKYRIGPEGDAGFARLDTIYRESVSELPTKRRNGMLLCMAAWIVPMALLYVSGLVIDWITRGNRGNQA